MFLNIWFVAAIWMGLALTASLVSIWSGISVALIEILVGVLAGNFLHLQANNEWIGFLAMLGSGVLTGLAIRAVRSRLVAASGADCGNCALDHLSRGGLRGDDRRRLPAKRRWAK